MQIEDIFVDVEAQVEVVTPALNPVDGLVFFGAHIDVVDFFFHGV